MYFLVALFMALLSGVLWFFFKDRKGLHLDFLAIIFGAAAAMWLIDCIFSATSGEAFVSFEAEDGWISLWTVLGGIFLWLILSFIVNNAKKVEKVEAK